jgi:hypothetical protein
MIKRKVSPWKKLKLKAPKIPDITCPIIDDVIRGLEKLRDEGKTINKTNTKAIMRKLERLRTANELLREGGEYWYLIAKKHLSKKKIL